MIPIPSDFKDFLKLLNSHKVRYLLLGGYAVAYYGYPRGTADMDIFIQIAPDNAQKMMAVLTEFGFAESATEIFLEKDRIVRMGLPPLRIGILTGASGIKFDDCYQRRNQVKLDEITVNLIHFDDLIKNKLASRRYKDLNDVENLSPESLK